MSLLESKNSAIAEAVAVARSLNNEQLLLLTEVLSQGRLPLSSGMLQVQHILHFPTAIARNIVLLFRSWQVAGEDAEALAKALLVAHAAFIKVQADTPSIRLVWTGPISTAGPARRTMSVLIDIINKARQQIVVVGYALTEGAAIIFEHLAAAQRRGVQVILIGDRMAEKLTMLQAYWPANQNLPLLYTRNETASDPKAALHAKLTVADQRYMLVTSANLTYHGLSGNIEIGVEIEGQVAVDAIRLLNLLIEEGIFIQV